jgi:sialate O-acetylesterase
MTDRIAVLAALSAALCSAAAPAHAEPVLGPLFTDHAVLQRERPIAVWGTADPGEEVTVTLGSATARGRADESGEWRIELPAMKAGGPHRLVAARAEGATAAAEDVLIGDVWLCSGQSNMELAVSHSLGADAAALAPPDPQLRLFTVQRRAEEAPVAQVDGGPWQIAGPDTIPPFSAACYFMVRDLRDSERVPIGAIHASWGGTQVRAWMSEETLAAVGDEDSRLFALYRTDPATADARLGEEWERWWHDRSGDAPGTEPWNDSSRLGWAPAPAIASWESWGDRLAGFDGMVWFRNKLTLTAAEAARTATLELGAIDDQDEVWMNGRLLGGRAMWDAQRKYSVPPGVLRAGQNEIVVNAYDTGGAGGFSGPAERLRLAFADGTAKPLASGWEYSVVEEDPGLPPRAVWDFPLGFTWIHNAMIAPLRDYGLTGVAWYQGEADVGMRGSYADRLGEMMRGWRRQFRNPELPLLIVSLANFGSPQLAPTANSWAALRDQQRLAAARDPRAELVVAMDLGERTDIHPANKLDLGHRLARGARRLAYGGAEPTGPEAVRAWRTDSSVVVEFTGVTGALHSWSSSRVTSVELCAGTQASCRYADAVAEGATLRIADDRRPATRVRYGWAAAPVTNLYDDAPLPAGPFELTIE